MEMIFSINLNILTTIIGCIIVLTAFLYLHGVLCSVDSTCRDSWLEALSSKPYSIEIILLNKF